MKRKTRLALIVGGVLLVLSGVAAYAILGMTATPAAVENCNEQDGIRICLAADRHELTSRDTVTYTVTIRNMTSRDYTQTFGSTCTDPIVKIESDPLSGLRVCGDAATKHTLAAGESQTYTIRQAGAQYAEGNVAVYASWGTHKSQSISLTRHGSEQADISRQFNECQSLPDNAEPGEIPGFCRPIVVMVERDTINCQQFRDMLAPINLTLPCDDTTMAYGIGYVYVPQDDSRDWAAKIQELTGVESAT